jgi:SLOG in TRPM, prokaryote/Protein of unknown function (DUF4231)
VVSNVVLPRHPSTEHATSEFESFQIDFPDGAHARAVRVPRLSAARDISTALGLPPASGVVVVNGGTTDLGSDVEERIRLLFASGLAPVADEMGLAIISGGTDAGIFSLLGGSLADHPRVACVGVAPAARVTWPGRTGAVPDAVPLEPHHSHFVLVDGDEWGDELGTMLRLAAAVAGAGSSLALLAGGGEVAKDELVAHVRAGRELVVLAGSGRLADDVASAAAAGGSSRDLAIHEAVTSGRVTVLGVTARPKRLRQLIRDRLSRGRRRKRRAPALVQRFPVPWNRPPPDYPLVSSMLRADLPMLEEELAYLDREIVPRFRVIDHAAVRAQHSFRLASVALIFGGAIATSLGAAQTAVGGGSLGVGVAEAVVAAAVSGVTVYARGRRFQQTYLHKRVAAERMKSQYYLYLTRAGIYGVDDDGERDRRLRGALDKIEAGEDPA